MSHLIKTVHYYLIAFVHFYFIIYSRRNRKPASLDHALRSWWCMNGPMEKIKPYRAPSAHPAYHDRSLSTLSLAGTLNPTQRFAKKRQHGQGQAAVAVAQSNLYKKRIFLNLLIRYSFYGTGSFTQNY